MHPPSPQDVPTDQSWDMRFTNPWTAPYHPTPTSQSTQQTLAPRPAMERPYGFDPDLDRGEGPSRRAPQMVLPAPIPGPSDMHQYMPKQFVSAKRPRTDSPADEYEPMPPSRNKAKNACDGCKQKKVGCQRKGREPCDRCLRFRIPCITPEPKARQAPPKREDLFKLIVTQADLIRDLVLTVEDVNRQPLPIEIETALHTSDTYRTGKHKAAFNTIIDTLKGWAEKAKEALRESDGVMAFAGAALPLSDLVALDSDEESEDEEGSQHSGPMDGLIEIEKSASAGDMTQEPGFSHWPRGRSASDPQLAMASFLEPPNSPHIRRSKSSTRVAPAILPQEAVPLGLFWRMALKAKESNNQSAMHGIAHKNYFFPSPIRLESHLAQAQVKIPSILSRGVVLPNEVDGLFEIYFKYMNPSVSLLDRSLYEPHKTYFRSPFLFTVICAIASRFYTGRPDMYSKAMYHAQIMAGTTLIGGCKNVEMCQAYILLSLYPGPITKWENQRSWLYLGIAIRTATDLNLHLPNTIQPRNEAHAREILNRNRTWLNCFNLDRSMGSQFGKPPTISDSDFMANHSGQWWHSSQYNLDNMDIHIACYNSELRVMARFFSKVYNNPHTPDGVDQNLDLGEVASNTDNELQELWLRWSPQLDERPNDLDHAFRTNLLRIAFGYARLVSLSHGFRHAIRKVEVLGPYLERCRRAATDVVHTLLHRICQADQVEFWKHGPEAQCVFVTFACAFLIKLLHPRFSGLISPAKQGEIRQDVQNVVKQLASPAVSIDDQHGPRLYSKFLEGLLDASSHTNHTDVGDSASHHFFQPTTTFTHTPVKANNALPTLVPGPHGAHFQATYTPSVLPTLPELYNPPSSYANEAFLNPQNEFPNPDENYEAFLAMMDPSSWSVVSQPAQVLAGQLQQALESTMHPDYDYYND